MSALPVGLELQQLEGWSPGGDTGKDLQPGRDLSAVPQCPDGCSSSFPLPQELELKVKEETSDGLKVGCKAEGTSWPFLQGSERGVPALLLCSSAASGHGVAWPDICARMRWRGKGGGGIISLCLSVSGQLSLCLGAVGELDSTAQELESSEGPWDPAQLSRMLCLLFCSTLPSWKSSCRRRRSRQR